MRRIIPILALIAGLTLSTYAMAQETPPDTTEAAEVALDAGAPAADEAAPLDTSLVLPPPVAGEPTDVAGAVEKGGAALKAFKSGDTMAGIVASLLLAVFVIRLVLGWFKVKLSRFGNYVLVFVVAFMQQAALTWSEVPFSLASVLAIVVAVLASGKLFDMGRAGVEKLKAGTA